EPSKTSLAPGRKHPPSLAAGGRCATGQADPVIAIQLQELTERGDIASLGPPHQLLNICSAAAHRLDPAVALDTKRPPFPPRRIQSKLRAGVRVFGRVEG